MRDIELPSISAEPEDKSDPTGSFVGGDPQISGGSPKDLQELNQAARDETRGLFHLRP
jgi:hypothetical protein